MADLIAWTFAALGHSAPGRFLAASTAAFAATEAVHLLGLAGLGGAVIVLDLAVLGVIFRGTDLPQLARGLLGVFLASLAVMVVSGTLLVAAGPSKYLLNALFGPKLAMLAVALVLHLLLYPVTLRRLSPVRLRVARGLATASLAAWPTVAILGRWLGLI